MFRKKLFFCSFFLLLFFLAFAVKTERVNADFDSGKQADSGTWMIVRYYDPNLDTLGYDGKTHKGVEITIQQDQVVAYQEIHCYFLFPAAAQSNISYSVSYEIIKTDPVTNEKYLDLDGKEQHELNSYGSNFAQDYFTLRIDSNYTYITIQFEDISFSFWHLTDESLLSTTLTNMQFTYLILGIVVFFAFMTFVDVKIAGFIVKKAGGSFDISVTPILVAILGGLDALVLLVPSLLWNIDKLIYKIPWSLFAAFSSIIIIAVSIQYFSKNQDYWNFTKYNWSQKQKGLRNKPFIVRPSADGKRFQEVGFIASLNRLVARNSPAQSINTVKFITAKEQSEIILNKVDVEKYIRELKDDQDKELVSREAVLDGKEKLVIEETIKKVEDDPLVNTWYISVENALYTREYRCIDYRITPSKIHKLGWWIVPIIVSCLAAIAIVILLLITKWQPSPVIWFSKLIKESLAFSAIVAAVFSVFVSIGMRTTPPLFEYQPARLCTEKDIELAMNHLQHVFTISNDLAELKDDYEELKVKSKIDVMRETTAKAEKYLDNLIFEIATNKESVNQLIPNFGNGRGKK